MKLQGITIDFDDRKTCGLLPELCLNWDEKYEALEDNVDLINYWETNFKKIADKTDKIVAGNIEAKSIVYSADEEVISLIKETFKEINLKTIEYDDIMRCDHCLTHDYLDENFIPKK